jgi:hypothetical protein
MLALLVSMLALLVSAILKPDEDELGRDSISASRTNN